MWRVLIFVAICVALLVPHQVGADTSVEVTVTAAGYICEAPGGFTLTYVNDHEVGISWTKGEGAANTLIRAKYGSYPEDETDGYLVYYGDGEGCSDTAVSLDETATAVHYRAWSENVDGIFTAEWAEGTMEGIGMTLIAIVVLVLGLLGFSIYFKNRALMTLAAAAGIALAVFGFSKMSASGSDAYWVLGVIGAVLTIIAMLMAAFTMREPGETGPSLPPDEEYAEELRQQRTRTLENVRRYRRF